MVVTPFGTTFGGAEQWLLTFLRHAVNDLGFSVDVVPTGASGAAIAMAARKLLAVRVGRNDAVIVEPARPPEPLVPYKGIDVALRALAYQQARSWRGFRWSTPVLVPLPAVCTRVMGRPAWW